MQSGKLLRAKFDPPRNLRLPLAGNPQVNLSCQPVALVRQRRTRTAYAVLLVRTHGGRPCQYGILAPKMNGTERVISFLQGRRKACPVGHDPDKSRFRRGDGPDAVHGRHHTSRRLVQRQKRRAVVETCAGASSCSRNY